MTERLGPHEQEGDPADKECPALPDGGWSPAEA